MNNLTKKIIASAATAALILPVAALAQLPPGAIQPPAGRPFTVVGVANVVLTIVWIVAVVFFIIMFIVAGFQFFNAKGDADALSDARRNAIYGVVGLVVAVLGWSMVQVIKSAFGGQ